MVAIGGDDFWLASKRLVSFDRCKVVFLVPGVLILLLLFFIKPVLVRRLVMFVHLQLHGFLVEREVPALAILVYLTFAAETVAV